MDLDVIFLIQLNFLLIVFSFKFYGLFVYIFYQDVEVFNFLVEVTLDMKLMDQGFFLLYSSKYTNSKVT
jgi:hypothetical protein